MLVVDPFCGSGSVLMEAMMLGCDVIGSDISEKAVADSKLNLEWLSKNYQIPDNKYRVFEEDATNEELVNKIHNSKFIIHNSSQQLVVVTEPYLGCPKKFKQTYASAEREYLKIKELYINFLSNIKQLTINDTPLTICLAFPLIETFENKKFSLYRHSVDEIRKLGYTQACEPFVYGRDYQVVKREIVLLRLKQE
jgi:tRNA G10  N-methylase Trm11